MPWLHLEIFLNEVEHIRETGMFVTIMVFTVYISVCGDMTCLYYSNTSYAVCLPFDGVIILCEVGVL